MRESLLLLILMALSSTTFGAENPENLPVLDTNAIHGAYLEGDFDQATALLENAFKQRAIRSHAESVFVYKHLGVMYAAVEGTREKGKYYMHQLLSVEPTARIMDMYASDMIYMIFRNIKEEFEIGRERLSRAQNHVEGKSGGPASAPARTVSGDSVTEVIPSRKPYRYYLGGAGVFAALVGVGFAVHYFTEEEAAPLVQNNDVD